MDGATVTVSEKLRTIRKRLKYPQHKLALVLDTCQSQISCIERGMAVCNPETVAEIDFMYILNDKDLQTYCKRILRVYGIE